MADTAPGVLTLPDIAYERATIRTKIDGRTISAECWVSGPGCPARVVAEYARKHYRFAVSSDAPDAAYVEFLSDALRVVSDNQLSIEDADLLAGEPDRAETILRHLKWRKLIAAEDTADPEAVSEDETPIMPRSSLISLPTSEASARTAAAG